MSLNKKAFGLASGILWGVIVLAATFVVMWRGGGDHLYLLKQFYPGYEVSFWGAFIGLVYGFADGFVCGYAFAWLYNKLAKK